jgi:hypothetical protein
MNGSERAERDEQIVEARRRGLSWNTIGRSFRLDPDHCRRIYRQYRQANPLYGSSQSEEECLAELDDRLSGAIEELALISANTDHPSARVGAIKARIQTEFELFQYRQAIGVAPQLRAVKLERDLDAICDQIVAVLRKHDVAIEAQKEIAAALRSDDSDDAPGARRAA